jgi:UDP-glucose 4-epimerase
VPIFVDRALKSETLTIYGDGEQTRDFVFVKDIVAANAFFAMQSKATGVFNMAYGRQMTINELAKLICRLTGSRSKIQYAPERNGDVKHSLASIDKIREAGFISHESFEGGLKDTIHFFRTRLEHQL